jgi:hypothetical protein
MRERVPFGSAAKFSEISEGSLHFLNIGKFFFSKNSQPKESD